MRRSTRLIGLAILIGLAAGSFEIIAEQTPPATAAQPRQPAFVALYERGSAWNDASGAFQQTGIKEHMQFLQANSEKLIGAAPFRQGLEAGAADRTVGMVIVMAATQEEAERLISNDPAIAGKLMRATVRQWMVDRVRGY